jgi:hypothetical protein
VLEDVQQELAGVNAELELGIGVNIGVIERHARFVKDVGR